MQYSHDVCDALQSATGGGTVPLASQHIGCACNSFVDIVSALKIEKTIALQLLHSLSSVGLHTNALNLLQKNHAKHESPPSGLSSPQLTGNQHPEMTQPAMRGTWVALTDMSTDRRMSTVLAQSDISAMGKYPIFRLLIGVLVLILVIVIIFAL